MNFKLVDKAHFVHIGLAHSPAEIIIYEEVGVCVVCVLNLYYELEVY